MGISKVQSVIPGRFRVLDSFLTLPSGDKAPLIQGPASHTEVRSQKGYRYREGFWDKVINDPSLQKMIEGRDMLGMIEHPADDKEFMSTPLDKASHIITRAWYEDKTKDPYIVAALLNNPYGNAIKALVDLGHKPGVSTRALGDYKQDDVSEYLDEDNFGLLTWDIVRNPNFEDIRLERVSDSLAATPLFREVVQMYQLRDSVDENYSRANLISDMQKAIDSLTGAMQVLKKTL